MLHSPDTRFLLGAVYCFICAQTRGAGVAIHARSPAPPGMTTDSFRARAGFTTEERRDDRQPGGLAD